jgi:O-methyltransferase
MAYVLWTPRAIRGRSAAAESSGKKLRSFAHLLYSRVMTTTPSEAGFRHSISIETVPRPESPEELYLDLLKKILTRALIARPFERQTVRPSRALLRRLYPFLKTQLRARNYELVRLIRSEPIQYIESGTQTKTRVEDAETMLGTRQLDNMQACITDVVRSNVPGDLLEAGVWRGGMTIFMRAVLKAYGERSRAVWVADSFEGLPEPDRRVETFQDWKREDMAVSLEEVRANFARYGLLDDGVRFLKGFFDQTLPKAPISQLAILRVDADLYQSTRDVLDNLYHKLSPGGYAIFDDYWNLPDCRRAIDEYREREQISDPVQRIDQRAVFWQKTR